MSITLGGITLPTELVWVDEFDWQSIEQNISRSLGGRVFVQQRTKINGQPILLAGYEQAEWIDRATLEQLTTLAAQGSAMTLLINSDSYQVRFDYPANPIQATPVIDYSDPAADDFYTITIQLVTV